LVRQYVAGNRGAGDELVRKFTPLVRTIAQRVLGPGGRDTLDDACQVAFLKVFVTIETWEGRCPFCDWLAVVTTRRMLDQVRSARASVPMVGLPRDIVDPHPHTVAPEKLECVERVVARLSPEWKLAYQLAIDGEDRSAIARAVGRSVRTVHYWLATIRDELDDCLDG
jgi:RNA polymerase sigma factor (sigma-70 family)